MATAFLNSLSSIMYVAQIFGIMPVLHRPSRGRRRRRSSSSANIGGDVHRRKDTPTYPRPPLVTMAVLNLHDKRVFGEDDANGIVNIMAGTDTSVKDYVQSDKSSDVNEQEPTTSSSSSKGPYYVTQFDWKCPNTVYSMLLIALGVFEWGCTVYNISQLGISLGTIGSFNFYTIATLGLIMFFNLARKWSQLHAFWTDAARVFDELPYRSNGGGAGRGGINPGVKIRTVFCTWVLAAAGTYLYLHIMYVSTDMTDGSCASLVPGIHSTVDST